MQPETDSPPAFTPLPAAILNDVTMPAALFRAFARLYAAAWRSGYQHTEALDFEAQIVPLLGVNRSQARQQLRTLRFAKLIDWQSDGQNRYVIYLLASRPELRESEKSDSVVGGGFNPEIESMFNQQQQTESEKPDSEHISGAQKLAPTDSIPAADFTAPPSSPTERFLLAAGIWPDVALRLARQISANELRTQQQGGELVYLPDAADVLGWIAYNFADRKKNNIAQPAAVLAANLNANRRCPQEYRPAWLCSGCRREVEYCTCDPATVDETPLLLPDEYLEAALRPRQTDYHFNRTFWGVCTLCRGLPCQC